jgi:hypothetical protein
LTLWVRGTGVVGSQQRGVELRSTTRLLGPLEDHANGRDKANVRVDLAAHGFRSVAPCVGFCAAWRSRRVPEFGGALLCPMNHCLSSGILRRCDIDDELL